MQDPVQLLLLLDIQSDFPDEPVQDQLSRERARRIVLRASREGAPSVRRQGSDVAAIDWDGLGHAIARLAARARAELREGERGQFFIAGHAPLPVFIHLGLELSAWAGRQTLLNQRKDGSWDVIEVGAGKPPISPFFTEVRGLDFEEPSEASGNVAVFISTKSAPAPRAQIRAMLQRHGSEVAAVVELRTSGPMDAFLSAEYAGSAAAELEQAFSRIAGLYPHRTGLSLFIAGPATLAYLAGWAINPNLFTSIMVANYEGGDYQLALTLPWRRRDVRVLSQTTDDVLARKQVLEAVLDGIEALRAGLSTEDLPPFMEIERRERLIKNLRSLKLKREPWDGQFALHILSGELKIGAPLLEALRPSGLEVQRRFGQTLVLHEVYHLDQHLQSTNFHGIGRAGFALEEVDFWADAVALGAIASWEVREGGERAKRRVAGITRELIEATIAGIQAFDKAEQEGRLELLYERRLRRYLLWHLQRIRAGTLLNPGDVWELFGRRVVIELAPLAGMLDARHDKLVKHAVEETELHIVIGGRLLRFTRTQSFKPGELVEAVRSFDGNALSASMEYVVHERPEVLAPWRGGSEV